MNGKRKPEPSRFQLVVRQPALFAARQEAAAEVGELTHRQLAQHLLNKADALLKSGELSLRNYEDEREPFSVREAEINEEGFARLANYIEQIRALVREGTERGAS